MKTTTIVILVSLALSGCNFSKSVKKDFVSGLTTTGNVLSCDDVYLSVNDERTTKSSFPYGEKICVNYDDIQGFIKENGNVFPELFLVITDLTGDTVMYTDDLYSEYKDGLNYTPLKLVADLTLASPMHSNREYNLSVNIRDKKGSGTFNSKYKFSIKPDEMITVNPEEVQYNEAYLFSQGNDRVITDTRIKFDDNIYIFIEGLKGFKEENGLVYPGLSLQGKDSKDNNILDYSDLFSGYTDTGIAASDFTQQVSAHFKLTGSEFNNPFHVELNIWDKKSSAKLRISVNLTVEQ